MEYREEGLVEYLSDMDGADLTQEVAAQVEIGSVMEMIENFDVTADPSNDRYLIQDDDHQYALEINMMMPGSEGEKGYAIVSANESRFPAKEELRHQSVLGPEEEILEPVGDRATYDDRSEAIVGASKRVQGST